MVKTERFTWDDDKNKTLLAERGITFEEIVVALETSLIDHGPNPGHPRQDLFIVEIDGYAWAVPADPLEDGWFLRTAYPSRKFTKRFLWEKASRRE